MMVTRGKKNERNDREFENDTKENKKQIAYIVKRRQRQALKKRHHKLGICNLTDPLILGHEIQTKPITNKNEKEDFLGKKER